MQCCKWNVTTFLGWLLPPFYIIYYNNIILTYIIYYVKIYTSKQIAILYFTILYFKRKETI